AAAPQPRPWLAPSSPSPTAPAEWGDGASSADEPLRGLPAEPAGQQAPGDGEEEIQGGQAPGAGLELGQGFETEGRVGGEAAEETYREGGAQLGRDQPGLEPGIHDRGDQEGPQQVDGHGAVGEGGPQSAHQGQAQQVPGATADPAGDTDREQLGHGESFAGPATVETRENRMPQL